MRKKIRDVKTVNSRVTFSEKFLKRSLLKVIFSLAWKPRDENPFAESYLFYKLVDDGFSKSFSVLEFPLV